MSEPWNYLLTRYGREIEAPTRADIQAAASELLDAGLADEGDDEEHGSITLRHGRDEGPLYVLELTCGGIGRWEEWADLDFNVELCPVRELPGLPQDQGVELLQALVAGDIARVRLAFGAGT